nr:hypothetical protein CFP56_52489 [Quercus suber]
MYAEGRIKTPVRELDGAVLGLVGLTLQLREPSHGGRLEVRDANDVDRGHEDAEAEGDDEHDLGLSRETHAGQDGHGQEQNGEIGQNVEGRGGEVDGDDVGAMGVCRRTDIEGDRDRIALKGGQHGDAKPPRVHHEEGAEAGPAEDSTGLGQGEVEGQDRGLDHHERWLVHDGESVDGTQERRLPFPGQMDVASSETPCRPEAERGGKADGNDQSADHEIVVDGDLAHDRRP